jgi:Ca2+-binding EF-hand superfamily protein
MKLCFRLWVLLSFIFIITYSDAYGEVQEEDIEDIVDEPPEYDDSETQEQLSDLDGVEEVGDDAPHFDALTSEQARGLHGKIDADGNGKVSLMEAIDYAHKMRRAMAQLELDEIVNGQDTDKDGKLTLEEFMGDPSEVSESRQQEITKEFKSLYINADGFVDPNELTSLYHHHVNDEVEHKLTAVALKDKDQNKDSTVSLTEFYAHLQMEGEPEEEIEEEDKAVFEQLDTDKSGTLSLAELKAWESGSWQAQEAVRKLFEHADKDHDGHITLDELDSAREDIANHDDFDAQMYLMQWVANHDDL